MENLMKQGRISTKLRVMLLALALFVGTQNGLCDLADGSAFGRARTQGALLDGSDVVADKIYNILASAFRTAASLNYFKDSGVAFDFGMGNKVYVDWGFAGSGDIFKPLESVKPDLKLVEDKDGRISATGLVTTFVLKEFSKRYAKEVEKKEADKKPKKQSWKNKAFELLSKLPEFELTPLHLFGLKLILLVKSLDGELDNSYLFEEVACLLFRLSLVGDLPGLDKNKRLTSYLPESLNEVLEDTGLGLSNFIDQIWHTIVCNKALPAELSLKKPVTVHGFVFTDKRLACEAYNKFKDYKEHDFCADFEAFGDGSDKKDGETQAKFQIVDPSDFRHVSGEATADDPQPFARNQVGYREFNFDNNTLVDTGLEKEILQQIKALEGKEGVIYVDEQGKGKFWVAQVSHDMGVIGAVKSLVLTFVRTFKEYVTIKKSLYDGSSDSSKQYRGVVKKREDVRKDLEKFIRSVEGKPVFEDICRRVKAVVYTGLSEDVVIKLQNSKAELERDITRLEALKAANEQRRDDIDQKAALNVDQVRYALLTESGKLTEEIASLVAQINAKQQEIGVIAATLSGEVVVEDQSMMKDKQELERLKQIVQEEQVANVEIPQEVFKEIDDLQQKITDRMKQNQSKVKFEDRLVAREKVALIFDQKAAELKKELEQKRCALDQMQDGREKNTKERLFRDSKSLIDMFIARLEVSAKEIRLNSEKAKELEDLRKSDLKKRLSNGRKELDMLELEVGHILDGNTHENFINNLMMRSSIFNEFVKDMVKDCDPDDRIIGLKQGITEAINGIMDGSEMVKDNVDVLKFLMQYMPASLKALLRISGAGQLVGA